MKPALTLFLVLCAGPLAPLSAQSAVDVARAHRERHGAEILADFAALLRLPNVAANLPDVRRNAEAIAERFRARGATMELLEIEGAPPIVYGRLDAQGATRTLGVYVHYDGQPVDADAWTHSPWEPTLYTAAIEAGGVRRPLPSPGTREPIGAEWRLYARASGDDKAPLVALLAALDALQGARIALTSNLVFFFEGEEEAGSPHLGQYLAEHAAKLDVDGWLICDGPVHQSRRPQLVFGVRGITSLEITVYGAARNLHSGHYGNWAPNPGMMLARLLASMKDERGRVLVDGFYDTVVPPGEAERAALAKVPAVEEALKAELGLARTEGGGASLSERLLLPSLNVRGLKSANVGALARNVIPATATAAIDVRLVKGNRPAAMLDLVEAHVRAQGYHVVRTEPDHATRLKYPKIARITRGGGYVAARTAMDHPIARSLVAAANEAAGEEVVLLPSLGGSLPLYLFVETLKQPVVIVPIANHDDNQHAPDENIRLANLWYGIDLMAAVLTMD